MCLGICDLVLDVFGVQLERWKPSRSGILSITVVIGCSYIEVCSYISLLVRLQLAPSAASDAGQY